MNERDICIKHFYAETICLTYSSRNYKTMDIKNVENEVWMQKTQHF